MKTDDLSRINANLVEINLRLKRIESDAQDLSDKVESEVNQLTIRIDEHESEESQKMSEMISVMTENTKTINDLVTKTQTIIDLTTDAQGFIKMSKRIGNFLIWSAKLGGFIGIILAAFHWVKIKIGV